MIRGLFTLIFCLFIGQQVFAAPTLEQVFTESFYTHYESGNCGTNIMDLLERAEQAGVDISKTRIIDIQNKGFSIFGMVAVEYARSRGRINPDYPASGLRNLPGDMNWYHHVVLEFEGRIYDYDFGNNPQVVSIDEYFEKMFFDTSEYRLRTGIYAGREEKMKSYELEIRSGQETIHERRERRSSPEGRKIRLGDYLAEYAHFSKSAQALDKLATSYRHFLRGHAHL